MTITNLAGGQQSARPFTISRVFAQGEIASYAQPSVGGTPLAVWQCDRMNSWPDGSLKHALISFRYTVPATGPVQVSFVNNSNPSSAGNIAATQAAALTQTQMLAFDPGTGPGTWGGDIEATNAAAAQTASVRTMLAASAWRYWLRGPVVTQVIVEDRTAARAFDFGWQCTADCTGNYSSATWQPATAGSKYQSLHPIFVTTFYPGWAGVKIEYILEDPWTDRMQDQWYSLSLKAHVDLSTTEYTRAAFGHNTGARWRRVYWDGAMPANANVDHNLSYLVASHALPNYDTSRVVGCCGPTTAGGLEVASLKSSTVNSANFGVGPAENLLDIRETGEWTLYMPTSGGREDIGPFPSWEVRWLYSQADPLYRVMIANISAVGLTPVHLREARTDNYFLSSAVESPHVTKALGHGISVDGRPSSSMQNWSWGNPIDQLSLVGPSKSTSSSTDPGANPWTLDQAHVPQMGYLAYLATGDWYLLEEVYMWAHWAIYSESSGTDLTARNADMGYINEVAFNTRGGAWPLRNLMLAAFAAPNADPESLYFNNKLTNNIAVKEGRYNVTNGHFYNTPAWQWGRNTMASLNVAQAGGASNSNPLQLMNYNVYTPCVGGGNSGCNTAFVAGAANYADSYWQYNYMNMVTGWMNDLGYPADKLNATAYKLIIDLVQPPGTPCYTYNPWLIGTYVMPVLDRTNQWFQTTSAMWAAWNSAYHDITGWPVEATPGNIDHAYNLIAQTAASFMTPYADGSLTGQSTWNWLQANNPYQSQYGQNTSNCAASGWGLNNCDDPKWDLVPRSSVSKALTSCDINLDGVVNSADVQLAINVALGLSPVSGDLSTDVSLDGVSNIIDVQIIINAALGGACITGH